MKMKYEGELYGNNSVLGVLEKDCIKDIPEELVEYAKQSGFIEVKNKKGNTK